MGAEVAAAPKPRRWLKRLGYAGAGFAAFVAIGLTVVVVASNSMLAEKVEVPVAVSPLVIKEGDEAAIARGQYLVDHVLGCKLCHAPDFAGRAEVDDPMIGKLWAPNLTLGEGSVTRDYTPVDWARSIRHGVGKDGRRLVLMPSEDYFTFSDEDLGSVVAYIKSMPNVDRANEGISVGPMGRVLMVTGEIQFAYQRIPHATERPQADRGPTPEWGKVMIGACIGCHGEGLSGGKIPGTPPEWPPARNLTPHETGIKGWTYEQFSAALRDGKRPDGTELSKVMPWEHYKGMSDDDTRALYEYLQTVQAKAANGR